MLAPTRGRQKRPFQAVEADGITEAEDFDREVED